MTCTWCEKRIKAPYWVVVIGPPHNKRWRFHELCADLLQSWGLLDLTRDARHHSEGVNCESTL